MWKVFNQFFTKLDRKPDTWEERITLFVGYLISKGQQSCTIKSYISAIRAVLSWVGEKLDNQELQLQSLMVACKLRNDRVRKKFPIRKGLVCLLLMGLHTVFDAPQPYLITLYQTLFCTAYFGLFRIGELTLSNHTVLAKNVHIGVNKDKMLFILHSSKTHDHGKWPQQIKISAVRDRKATKKPKNMLCPFTLLRAYLQKRPKHRSDYEQFFIFSDGSPVQPCHFRNMLKLTLNKLEFDSNLYSTHRFRAGHSHDLLDLGVSVETIKKIRRWKSNAVFCYLR